MRLRAILYVVLVFALVGAGSWRVGRAAALWFEGRTRVEITDALAAAGENWASVTTDGLLVTLSGAAPDETSRFRALEVARRIANETRIEDATSLQAVAPLAPPAYALELLRNEAEVSLIGLVPETGGRDVIRAALGAGGLDRQVTDLLDSASDPAPDNWKPALGFGLDLLRQLPRAKLSITPGAVMVSAVAESEADRAALEERLRRTAPAGVALTLEISAPRPVIAPFAFDISVRNGTATLAACTADSDETAAMILAAARAAGLGDGLGDGGGCAVGLGAPSPDWGRAATQGMAALRALGGGRFTLNDLSAQLIPPADVAPTRLVEVSAGLGQGLPPGFHLDEIVPVQPTGDPGAAQTPAPRFEAVLGADGAVRLTGRVGDETQRTAVDSYARSLFGHEQVANEMDIDSNLPAGWPARVLAGVEALSALKEGTLAVTPDQLSLTGWGIDPEADARAEAFLDEKLEGRSDIAVDIAFNAAAARAAEIAARPRPEICAEQIDAILAAGSIQFAAGSADIVPESRGVIAAIADVLRGCPGADFEIGGHTDSQGPAVANLRLSTNRAQAVVAALKAEDLPLIAFTARGYGADIPVGDNATDAGRAMNRRIAFTLVDPDMPPASPEADGTEAAAEAGAAVACAAEADRILAASQIEFEAGAATIAPASAATVAALARSLAACPDGRFEIAGHTDAQGSEDGNARLSTRRAQAVVDALAAVGAGLPPLVARGYGESQPIADNKTEEGRARNRRIEVAPLDPDPDAPAIEAPAADTQAADTQAADPAAPAPPAAGTASSPAGPAAQCAADIDAILADHQIDFDSGAATITAASRPVVAEIAEALQSCPDAAFEIGGHTDAQGSEEGNLRLSQQRADAVLAALRGNGLALSAVTARGYGETQPVAEGETAAARAANRRIAFTLVTAQQDSMADGPQ